MGSIIGRDARRRLRSTWAAPAVALLAAVAVPAADARTKTVEAGPFTKKAQAAFQQAAADANAFFRRTVTIRRGDTVRWDINGFHTVTFVPEGGPRPTLVAPDADNPLTGVADAVGAPFWFNGQPRLILNPLAAFPQGGRRFAPSTLHNSGLPLEEGPPDPYRLTFRRKGSFRYLCIVHPGMRGTVKVLGRRARVPSARNDRRQARREQQTFLRRAQRRTTGPGAGVLQNAVQAGNDDRRGTAIFKFFPTSPRFQVGDVVTLQMSPRSTEDHTITFGPSNGRDAYNDQLATSLIAPEMSGGGPPTLVFEPRAVYPSENPAGGTPAYTAALHGNGFLNTGVMDANPDTPTPSSMTVRFTGAGTFTYICLIHPFMRDTLTVAP